MLFASLLVLPLAVRQQLRDHSQAAWRQLNRVREQNEAKRRLWLKFQPRHGAPSSDRVQQRADDERAMQKDEAEAHVDHEIAVAMECLLNEYVPALFHIGKLVRDLNWSGRAQFTGLHARRAMLPTIVVLMSLLGNRVGCIEHLRVLCLALLQWREWHEKVFGCCYSEEVPEAMLGRFGSDLQRHPHVTTVEAAYDLFLLVEPGQAGHKDLRADVPTQEQCRKVMANLGTFLRSPARVVKYTPWAPKKMCTTAEAWDTEYSAPARLGSIPPLPNLREILVHYVHVLVQRSPDSADDREWQHLMDETFKVRSNGHVALYHNVCRSIVAQQPLIRDFCVPVPRRAADPQDDAAELPRAARGFRGGRYHRVQEQQVVVAVQP